VAISSARSDITAREKPVDVVRGSEHETITVGPANPVIIDLHERRIEIGRPQL
jgi:hypothetical protein